MKEKTINALDEFIRQVCKFAEAAALVNPELKPQTKILGNSCAELRGHLQEEVG